MLRFFNGLWIVFHIEIDPHQPGNPKDVNKINCQKCNQKTERGQLAPVENPVKKAHKKQTKPRRPNVGNEHSAVVITRLGKVVELALRAGMEHVEWFYKRPTPGFKHLALVALRTLQRENTVCFGAFTK